MHFSLLSLRKTTVKTKNIGFSLVELLVSMAVLSTMMLLLFGFFDQATKAWSSSEKKIDAFREARAALYFLRRDLNSLLLTENLPMVYFDNPTTAQNQGLFVGNPPTQAHGDFIMFLSSQAPEVLGSGQSEVCAVGYYLAYWRTSSGSGQNAINNASFQLHRYFFDSDETWNNSGAGASTASGLFPFLQSNPNPVNGSFSGYPFAPATGTPNGDDVIARNVINFECRPYDEDNNPIIPSNPTAGYLYLDQNDPAIEEISYFRVALTAFNFDTAQKLSSPDDWYMDPVDPNLLQSQAAQIFTTKIAVP